MPIPSSTVCPAVRAAAAIATAIVCLSPPSAAFEPSVTSETAPAPRGHPAEPLPPPPPPPRAPGAIPIATVTPRPPSPPPPAPRRADPIAPAAQPEAPPSAPASPVDERFAAAALLAYSSDHLNLGVGARFGKTLENRIYVGGTFVYNLGESQSVATPAGTATASFSAFYVGPEAGYDFSLGAIVVRPYCGAGIASFSVSGQANGFSAGSSTTKFVIWPGGTLVYPIPDSAFFVGGDARLVTIPDGPAFGLVGFGGMHFGS